MGTMYKSTTVEFTRERAISYSRSSSRNIKELCFICHNHQAIYYSKEGFWYCHSFSSRNYHHYHFFVVVGIGFTFLVSLNRLIIRELPIIINIHDGRIRKHLDLSDNSHLTKDIYSKMNKLHTYIHTHRNTQTYNNEHTKNKNTCQYYSIKLITFI